jgi:hypothetical protein
MQSKLAIVVSLLLLLSVPVWSEEKPASGAKPSVEVTGVLLLADGSPAKGNEVVAYPLDAGGKAIAVQCLGEGGVVKLWNPVAKTDVQGRFVLTVPAVKSIGKTEVSRFGLSTIKPAGGLVTVTVWKMLLTDGSEEMVFVQDAAAMPMLRNAEGSVSIGFAEGSKDVGQIRKP